MSAIPYLLSFFQIKRLHFFANFPSEIIHIKFHFPIYGRMPFYNPKRC